MRFAGKIPGKYRCNKDHFSLLWHKPIFRAGHPKLTANCLYPVDIIHLFMYFFCASLHLTLDT